MANATVQVLLFPPQLTCDPSRPRADLLAFMVDPKKPIDCDYQGVDITNDRIFLDGERYGDLERDTQDKVRRELQECFAEQGCARSISVKEWAKQTTERQTPRLRLRCTKVCGFGFQVNFDMERKQYYLVRSKGKSGNFTHKCPAPAASMTPSLPAHQEETYTDSPPSSSNAVSVDMTQSMPMQPSMGQDAPAGFPTTVTPAPDVHGSFHAPPPVATIAVVPNGQETNMEFPVPGAYPAEIHHSLPQSAMSAHHDHHRMEHLEPALNEIPMIIPSTEMGPPAPVFSFNSDQLARESAAQAAVADFHEMDVSSVDSTDMMIARHFGTDDRKGSSALSILSDNSEKPKAGDQQRASSRTQVNNEAEYPTANSLRSFLSMMTGSINSTMGKAGFFFGRGQNNGSSQQVDENMLTMGSQTFFNNNLHRINSVGPRADKAMGGDPMDTVNSGLSGLSISGMHTLDTHEGTSGLQPDGNPFSEDFWNPPPQT